MATYQVEVVAYLNKTYTIAVDSDTVREAEGLATDEVFGMIDPDDIEIAIAEMKAL